MAQVQAYLGFTDNGKEAVTFYRQCLGGTLGVQTVGGSPVAADLPPKARERVLHSVPTPDDLTPLGSDLGTAVRPKGATSPMLRYTGPEETETDFQKLPEGGQVTPPFWGPTFGHLTGRPGFQWRLNSPR